MKTIMALTLASSTSAFAGGGSSIGPSACSYATYVCAAADNNTVACIYPDNKALVVLALANGGDFSKMYAANGVSVLGDVHTYDYADQLELKLLQGFDTSDGKVPAYISYGPAGFTNYPIHCTKN